MIKKITLGLTVFLVASLITVVANSRDSFTQQLEVEPVVENKAVQKVVPVKVQNLSIKQEQIIKVFGPIGNNAESIAKNIIRLSKKGKPIYLLMNSPGGSVMDGALIISAMESVKVPVYTVTTGMCASMCQIIHQYGTKRLMVNRTILMAHPASGGVQGTLQQMDALLGMITKYVDKFDRHIAKRAGIPFEKYKAMIVSELWLDAEDAMKLGFVDAIVSVDVLGEEAVGFQLPIMPEEKNKRIFLVN